MKNESAEVVNMQTFVQPEGSMKACIIAKQKLKIIIDVDIIETLIFGLLFRNSEEEGDEDYSFEQAKKNATVSRLLTVIHQPFKILNI